MKLALDILFKRVLDDFVSKGIVNPERLNPGQSEKIKLNFYFNTAFTNERVFKG